MNKEDYINRQEYEDMEREFEVFCNEIIKRIIQLKVVLEWTKEEIEILKKGKDDGLCL